MSVVNELLLEADALLVQAGIKVSNAAMELSSPEDYERWEHLDEAYAHIVRSRTLSAKAMTGE